MQTALTKLNGYVGKKSYALTQWIEGMPRLEKYWADVESSTFHDTFKLPGIGEEVISKLTINELIKPPKKTIETIWLEKVESARKKFEPVNQGTPGGPR